MQFPMSDFDRDIREAQQERLRYDAMIQAEYDSAIFDSESGLWVDVQGNQMPDSIEEYAALRTPPGLAARLAQGLAPTLGTTPPPFPAPPPMPMGMHMDPMQMQQMNLHQQMNMNQMPPPMPMAQPPPGPYAYDPSFQMPRGHGAGPYGQPSIPPGPPAPPPLSTEAVMELTMTRLTETLANLMTKQSASPAPAAEAPKASAPAESPKAAPEERNLAAELQAAARSSDRAQTLYHTKPLESDLKNLFNKHQVHPEIEKLCIRKGVNTCAMYHNVGYDKTAAREALAQLGNLDLKGEGVVPVANMLSVWRELHDLYIDRNDAPDESLAQIQVEQAIRLLETKFELVLPPYRMPSSGSMNLVDKNYRGRKYDVVDVRKMRCMFNDPNDPLSYRNKKDLQGKRFIQGADGAYHELDDPQELDFKAFRRAHDLYLFCELAVGNLANPKDLGQPLHMTMVDKIEYETWLMMFGYDPSWKTRMNFESLISAEYHCRAALFVELRKGKTWGEGLATLKSLFQSKFFLKSITSDDHKYKEQADKAQKEMNRIKNELENVRAIANAAKVKAGKGSDSYGRWSAGGGGGGGGGGGADQYIQKDKTGKYYCRLKNRGIEHDESTCQYLHECNWKACNDRKNCKLFAFKHALKQGGKAKGKGKKGKH